MSAVSVYAPGSVSNVGPGFDVFGFAIEAPGDVVEATWSERPGVSLTIADDDGTLPADPTRNTAAVAAVAALAAAGSAAGVHLTLRKGMPLASGLGSSAASAVAGAVAVDALCGLGLDRSALLRAALAGERAGCGAAHADNVGPALYGGFVLGRGAGAAAAATAAADGLPTVDLISLPVPVGLSCAVVRPHLAVETKAARALLGNQVPLADAVAQWGNAAGLVAALFRGDLELLARCLVDRFAEPRRIPLVPGFAAARDAALAAGAIGAGLSGSGPSLFALTADRGLAMVAGAAMVAALADGGVAADCWVSTVGAAGARVLPPAERAPAEGAPVEAEG